jgi:hypothetical protein
MEAATGSSDWTRGISTSQSSTWIRKCRGLRECKVKRLYQIGPPERDRERCAFTGVYCKDRPLAKVDPRPSQTERASRDETALQAALYIRKKRG